MIRLSVSTEDGLRLSVAIDTAITAIAACQGAGAIPERERDHAELMLRDLRSELLRKRGELLSAAIEKARNRNDG